MILSKKIIYNYFLMIYIIFLLNIRNTDKNMYPSDIRSVSDIY
jgi:hypothetical protein